jgi:uncharacterized protein (DUF2132 family)
MTRPTPDSETPKPVPRAESKDPLHGVTLERLLTELVAHFGWRELGNRIAIRCFLFDPSIKSSLTFLRKNPWARTKVEELYISVKPGY